MLNSVDLSGREIDPAVLSAATAIGPKAIRYAEKLLGDSAVAMTLFEDAAASVSEAIRTKQATGSAVRDLAGYLFRTYVRLVSHAKQKDSVLSESLDIEIEARISERELVRAEAALLLDEIMSICDRLTREVALRRLEGLSWKEIGEYYGISGHAAEARFSKALDRARKRLKINTGRVISHAPLPGAGIRPKKTKSKPPVGVDFLRVGKAHFAEDFPNPTREGCPPESTIKLLADKPTEVADAVLAHITSCSPCYKTYSHFLQQQQRKAHSQS